MDIVLTPWQLVGIVIGSAVGITTLVSVLIASGIRIGKFTTRDDLDRTSDKLEKKINDEVAGLDKKIDDRVGALNRKIDDQSAVLNQKIDDQSTVLNKKIDDQSAALNKKIDDQSAVLNKKIEDQSAALNKKIDDQSAALHHKIDENHAQVLLAIQNLGNRLENAILEHTHDDDGVAVFRRHPRVDAAN